MRQVCPAVGNSFQSIAFRISRRRCNCAEWIRWDPPADPRKLMARATWPQNERGKPRVLLLLVTVT